jgi:uncharacterized protein YyaL (SSP411 family)
VPNRLAAEQSPYLLQHKDNPVDWFPWGDAAFERARSEDKPIFLSIGYSTCHWCHVMEHESFEHEAVAKVLNEHFVSIKVDREERPDVDRVYMTFVQATTGSGGWPMSVWLTPALEPFHGGTYFPPESRWGRPGFVDLLQEIARVWGAEREKVVQSAAAIVARLRSLRGDQQVSGVPGPETLAKTVGDFVATFDRRRGGFGNAPKFPRPSELLFLFREHARTGDAEPRDMGLVTLKAMALGGMRDHLGGGFHRYSVDGDWRVPHFEKMLYDQAQLVLACVEAFQITGDRFYADVALDTLNYVQRDMTDPLGGYYSAEDADSVPPESVGRVLSDSPPPPHSKPHKMEGAFYIWRDDEIGDLLGPDAELFRLRFGVLPDGNAPLDPQQEFVGKNLLYTARPLDDIAARTGRTEEDVTEALARDRQTLFDAREKRPRPHLDDKVLTAWNGLMIVAFARAGRVIPGADALLHAAEAAASFIRKRLWNPATGTLLRRYRQGDAGVPGYAEDYAYLISGLLELFQADGNPDWLDWALTLQRRQDELFWDEVDAGWFSTSGTDPSVLLRMKEDYDGAEPAASSVAAMNLLTLTHLVEDAALSDRLSRTLSEFGARAALSGRAAPMMLAVLSAYHAGIRQVVVTGSPDAATPLLDVVVERYLPSTVVVPLRPQHSAALAELLPWTAAMQTPDGSATAYVCRDFTCQSPTADPGRLRQTLDS